MGFKIESTSFCPSGVVPRWTWWIRGIYGKDRYELLGTDEHGTGLYLFRFDGDRAPIREQLLDQDCFKIAASLSKTEASAKLSEALLQLGSLPIVLAT